MENLKNNNSIVNIFTSLAGAIKDSVTEEIMEDIRKEMPELQRHKKAISRFEQNANSLEEFGGVTNIDDIIAKYPLSPECLESIKLAVRDRVDALIELFPKWSFLRNGFILSLVRGFSTRFSTKGMNYAPAILGNEILDFVFLRDIVNSAKRLKDTLLTLA